MGLKANGFTGRLENTGGAWGLKATEPLLALSRTENLGCGDGFAEGAGGLGMTELPLAPSGADILGCGDVFALARLESVGGSAISSHG